MTQLCRLGHVVRRSVLALASIGMGLLAMTGSSLAQVYVGGHLPSVVVDLSVLDQLGTAPDLPNRLIPGVRAAGREPTPLSRSPFLSQDTLSRTASRPPREAPFLSRKRSASSHAPVQSHKALAKESTRSEKKIAPTRLKAPVNDERMSEPVEDADQTQVADIPRTEPLDAKDLLVRRPRASDQDENTSVRPPPPSPAPKAPAIVFPKTREAKTHEEDTQQPMPIIAAPARDAEPGPEPTPQKMASLPPPVPEHVEVIAAPVPPASTTPSPSARTTEGGGSSGGDTLTIGFARDISKLPEDGKGELRTLADRLSNDQGMKIHLLAYAAGDDSNQSQARRLSLSRALEVRAFLIDQGIPASRVEVKALGHRVPSGPADRVDITISQR